MPRYQFVGGTPRSFSIVFVLTFTNFLVAWCAGAFRQFWAREASGGVFTYPIHFKGSKTWYFPPAVGRYITWSFVGHFVAIVVLALICFRHRHELVRVDSPDDQDTPSE